MREWTASKLFPRYWRDRRFESVSLQERVHCELDHDVELAVDVEIARHEQIAEEIERAFPSPKAAQSAGRTGRNGVEPRAAGIERKTGDVDKRGSGQILLNGVIETGAQKP
jgi:hypothetical protein